jgi:hypothetical protein
VPPPDPVLASATVPPPPVVGPLVDPLCPPEADASSARPPAPDVTPLEPPEEEPGGAAPVDAQAIEAPKQPARSVDRHQTCNVGLRDRSAKR